MNETRGSTNDCELKVNQRSAGTHSKLTGLGQAVSKNHTRLIVATQATPANVIAERRAAIEMLGELSGPRRYTLAGDKGDGTRELVPQTRELNVVPHVAQKSDRGGGSPINVCTTRISGSTMRIAVPNCLDDSCGWSNGIGLLRCSIVHRFRKSDVPTLVS